MSLLPDEVLMPCIMVLETIRDVVNIASSRIQEEKRGAGRPPVPASDIVKVMLKTMRLKSMIKYWCTHNIIFEKR